MRRLIFPTYSGPPYSGPPFSHLPAAALCALALVLCVALAALAQPSDLAPVDAHDAAVVPGDPAWPFTRQGAGPLRFIVSLDPWAEPSEASAEAGWKTAQTWVQTRAGAGAFRIDFDLAAKTEDCACIGTSERRSHYKSRGIAFAVRASRPLAAILLITTSNPDDRRSRDRFFGTFHVGTRWRILHLPFRSLAALPSWPDEARLLGLVQGDLVLRPDSVEDIRIGVDGRRNEPGAGTLWVGAVRFFR